MKNTLALYAAQKAFGSSQVLINVSFKLKTGDILGLFGRNGSGKSTLLKILFGTLQPDLIDLKINEKALNPKSVISEQHIGYLPQDNFLPKHMKVRDIIPLFYNDGDAQDLIFRTPFIEKMATHKAGNLSMGQLRYLELVLIANLDHPFLLLDEPFSMIEPLYKEKIKEFLMSIKDKKGIIITDHYYNDVLDISTRNILISNGISSQIKDTDDLRDRGYLK